MSKRRNRRPSSTPTTPVTATQPSGCVAIEAFSFGEPVPVRARIYTVGGLSAHADQAELLHWLRGFHTPPRHTFVMHGEAGASATFAELLHAELGWSGVTVPRAGTSVSL